MGPQRHQSFEQKLLNKSAWKDRRPRQFQFYCPQCRHQRMLPFQPKPTQIEFIIQIGITAAFVTLLTWKWLEWKGMFSFLPLWATFEAFYRTRIRAVSSCPHCGFDPYLYLVDVQKARKEIESFWAKKLEDRKAAKAPAPAPATPAATPPNAVTKPLPKQSLNAKQ